MSKYLDKVKAFRSAPPHTYNCAQSVVMSFAEAAGTDEETAYKFAAGFGGGMKRGSTCGAVIGGIMALGLFGISDAETIGWYHRQIMEKYGECLDCAELLRINSEAGREKKPHCDGIVFFCEGLVEQILKERGLIE